MKVAIICEASGVVRDEFLSLGHDAWSCDILPRAHPRHITADCRTQDWRGFHLAICHPPCTHTAVSGAKHFHHKRREQAEAIAFIRWLMDLPVDRLALEQPVSIVSTVIRPPDQIIHPWQFGHEASKTTCLWLKNLPPLVPTEIVGRGEFITTSGGNRLPKWYSEAKVSSHYKTRLARSRTFRGIARAMAEQWGSLNEGTTHGADARVHTPIL